MPQTGLLTKFRLNLASWREKVASEPVKKSRTTELFISDGLYHHLSFTNFALLEQLALTYRADGGQHDGVAERIDWNALRVLRVA
jgi:hypothetical protein